MASISSSSAVLSWISFPASTGSVSKAGPT
jgi:hypothetical protein